jgi:hypothetical protein
MKIICIEEHTVDVDIARASQQAQSVEAASGLAHKITETYKHMCM